MSEEKEFDKEEFDFELKNLFEKSQKSFDALQQKKELYLTFLNELQLVLGKSLAYIQHTIINVTNNLQSNPENFIRQLAITFIQLRFMIMFIPKEECFKALYTIVESSQ